MATRSNTASIFFASIPDFKNLCSVILHLQDIAQAGERGETSRKCVGSQPQILKCRELIFLEPGILASPSLQEGHIYAILEQSLWKSGRFQARCHKMGIVVYKPTRVISAVFQACLAYTIRARLAPLWNKAGNWYLQGRDFLLASGRIPAIDMELNVTETEICLALRPLTIKLPQCSISDFEVCQPVLQEFFLSPSNVVSEYSIDSKWSIVLPSLKKGKVVSISHEIPATSPFKTYKDIRRYWKNAYGYRLPESNNGVLYYNIYFPAIGPTIFSYPQYCIRKQDPILQTRIDPSPILEAFLTDLQYKVPSICGTTFKVTPKAQFTNTELYPSSHEESNLSQLTLSCTPPPTSIRRIPTRHLAFQGYCSSSDHPQITPTLAHPVANLASSAPYPLSGIVGNFSAAPQTSIWQTIDTSQAFARRDSSTSTQNISNKKPEQVYAASQPIWDPISTQKSVQILHSASFSPTQFLSPSSFNGQTGFATPYTAFSRHPVGSATRSDISTNQYGPALMNDSIAPPMAPVPPRIIPRFISKKPKATSYSCIHKDGQIPGIVPAFLPTSKPLSQPMIPASQPKLSTGERITQPNNIHTREQPTTKPGFEPSFSRKTSSQVTKQPSVKKKTQLTLDAVVQKMPKGSVHTERGCSKATKRKTESNSATGDTLNKKPKTKAKIQEDLDVQSLALNDQLSKVNTVTLATWLRGKGIPVKAKDKKGDLIQKVAQFIHVNSIED